MGLLVSASVSAMDGLPVSSSFVVSEIGAKVGFSEVADTVGDDVCEQIWRHSPVKRRELKTTYLLCSCIIAMIVLLVRGVGITFVEDDLIN